MAQIEVKLKVFYGYDCMGQGYSHEKTQKIDINEQEFEALKKLGAKKYLVSLLLKLLKMEKLFSNHSTTNLKICSIIWMRSIGSIRQRIDSFMKV